MTFQAPDPVESSAELTPKGLEDQLRWTMYMCAQRLSGATDAREAQELGDAILKCSQAIVILDPALVAPQGVPADALHPPRPMPLQAKGNQ